MTEKSTTRRLSRVAPLALVVVLAAACGDDNEGTASPNEPPPPLATTTGSDTTPMPPAPQAPPAPTGTGTGTKSGQASLLMGTRDLLQLLEGDIRGFAPTQVTGKSLNVIAVVGPDGFWAGQSPKRILVKMQPKGGSPPNVKVGQKVNFVGVLTATGDDPSLGVRNGPDTELLTKQGAYVDVSAADVKLR